MNERIEKLADKAGFLDDLHGELLCKVEIEKFAELLVKECADYIETFNREHMVEEGIGGAEIRKHFGVEE